ncbi:MAG: bifunctional hydroxymethylpyrimidine kinase/phosphomethylpyrimidine kinase [Alphaproteobacteria bacterium]
MIPNILSIAGSDPSGGAGIQADLKTFSALGCYGMAAITALTAQNTIGVTAVHELPAAFVRAQLDAIFTDIRVDAVKIGMAGAPDVIAVIADTLKKYKPAFIILDPVMVAQSGDSLLSPDSIAALREKLIPLAAILTPNLPEAKILLGADYDENPENTARKLFEKFSGPAILLKGGHADSKDSSDIFSDKNGTRIFSAVRIATKNNHGTGCTLSSSITAHLAKGFGMEDAVAASKKYITGTLSHAHALDVGNGAGPVHHFFYLWRKWHERI